MLIQKTQSRTKHSSSNPNSIKTLLNYIYQKYNSFPTGGLKNKFVTEIQSKVDTLVLEMRQMYPQIGTKDHRNTRNTQRYSKSNEKGSNEYNSPVGRKISSPNRRIDEIFSLSAKKMGIIKWSPEKSENGEIQNGYRTPKTPKAEMYANLNKYSEIEMSNVSRKSQRKSSKNSLEKSSPQNLRTPTKVVRPKVDHRAMILPSPEIHNTPTKVVRPKINHRSMILTKSATQRTPSKIIRPKLDQNTRIDRNPKKSYINSLAFRKNPKNSNNDKSPLSWRDRSRQRKLNYRQNVSKHPKKNLKKNAKQL